MVIGAEIGLESRSRRDAAETEQTVRLLRQFSELKVFVSAAESAARGFALTGEQGFADDFRRAANEIPPAFAALLGATDDPAQRKLLEDTSRLAEQRLAIANDLIRHRSSSEKADAGARDTVADGRKIVGAIAANLDEAQAFHRSRLIGQAARSQLSGHVLLGVDVSGVALMLFLAGMLLRTTRRASRELAASLSATLATNESLEAAVAERTAHLVAAHEELRHSSSVIESTFHSMADAVLVINAKGDVLLANPAASRVLRFQPGMNVTQLRSQISAVYHADGVTTMPRSEMAVARALRGEEFDNLEFVTRAVRTGNRVHFSASARPLRDASGAISGAALVYHDVTASRETERKLQQAQKLESIGKLTGGVAHDFNNMLTVIAGTTETLAAGLQDRPALRAIATLIDQAAQRCSELTAHLLAFARRQPLHPRNVDVNAAISDVAKLLRPTLGEQIEIKTVLDPKLEPAHLDASQLANSLLNMALNARDAMPSGGRLTLETRMVTHQESGLDAPAGASPGRYVMIAVGDTGTGMPAHVREKVFEPFFTTKEVGKGTGLGLSMVYGFVTQSGGHVQIDSEEGAGTTIRLYLPPAQGAAEKVAIRAEPAKGGSERILVVEDDPLVRNFVTAQLMSLGYNTVSAADGPSALTHLKNGERFDLLFTDVVMPGGMSGRELADEAEKIRPGLKVLYTSGYTDDAIMHRGHLDPSVLLLQKPYRKGELARMVRKALGE